MGKHRKINIGDKLDYLIIVEDLGMRQYSNKRLRFYLCECKCGNRIELPGAYIGKAFKSCGCLQDESRRKDIPSGTKFDRLEVVERTEQKSHDCYMYRCNCSCGAKDVLVRSDLLRSGDVRSCGCIHYELFQENVKTAYANNFVENTSIPKLRMSNPQRNNTSGAIGVSWHKHMNKWYARIAFKGQNYSLGYYDSFDDAKKVREIAKAELHDEFLKWYEKKYKKRSGNTNK